MSFLVIEGAKVLGEPDVVPLVKHVHKCDGRTIILELTCAFSLASRWVDVWSEEEPHGIQRNSSGPFEFSGLAVRKGGGYLWSLVGNVTDVQSIIVGDALRRGVPPWSELVSSRFASIEARLTALESR